MALPATPSRTRTRLKSPAAEQRPLDGLREQLARESLASFEYERSSRRTLEALASQVASLRGSFEALAGSVHAELDRGRMLVSDRLSLLGEWQGSFEKAAMKGLQDQVSAAVAEELGRRLPDVGRSVADGLQETARRLLEDGEAALRAGLLAEADAAADARVQAAAGQLEGRLDRELRALDRRWGELEQGLDRRWGELEQGALREARHACELGRRAAQQGDRLLHGEEETAAALREVALVRRAHEGRLDELGRRAEDAERQLASLGEAAVAQREASAGLREQLREQLREELGAAARETSLLGDALGAERAKARSPGRPQRAAPRGVPAGLHRPRRWRSASRRTSVRWRRSCEPSCRSGTCGCSAASPGNWMT